MAYLATIFGGLRNSLRLLPPLEELPEHSPTDIINGKFLSEKYGGIQLSAILINIATGPRISLYHKSGFAQVLLARLPFKVDSDHSCTNAGATNTSAASSVASHNAVRSWPRFSFSARKQDQTLLEKYPIEAVDRLKKLGLISWDTVLPISSNPLPIVPKTDVVLSLTELGTLVLPLLSGTSTSSTS